MLRSLSLLKLALPALAAETTVMDVMIVPQWDTRNLTASVKTVEKSVTTWVYGCKASATFCGLVEGATVILGPTSFSQTYSYADPTGSVRHNGTFDCDLDRAGNSMVCDLVVENSQPHGLYYDEYPSSTLTDLSSYVRPLTLVGAIDMLAESSPDRTGEAGATGTESGGDSSPTSDAEEDSSADDEEDDNSGLRATFNVVAAGLAGLVGAAGLI